MKNNFDIIIVGGGLVGASLACALAPLNLRIAIIDQQAISEITETGRDLRTLALTSTSQNILTACGIWPLLAPTAIPLQHIHISKQKQFGSVRLQASDQHLTAFGYVVPMASLHNILLAELKNKSNVTFFAPIKIKNLQQNQQAVTLTLDHEELLPITAKILVAADGTHSSVRKMLNIHAIEKDYQQIAIVANMEINHDHHFTAYERFTQDGAIAALPLGEKKCATILIASLNQKEYLKKLSDNEYLTFFQQQFGQRLGKFTGLGKRQTFPLVRCLSKELINNRVALVGNAAQTIPPLAAQGFNLGLHQVAHLATLIAENYKVDQLNNIDALLKKYQEQQQAVRRKIIYFTDFLTRAFHVDILPVNLMRSSCFTLLENIPVMKKLLADFCRGQLSADTPLAAGISLQEYYHE